MFANIKGCFFNWNGDNHWAETLLFRNDNFTVYGRNQQGIQNKSKMLSHIKQRFYLWDWLCCKTLILPWHS